MQSVLFPYLVVLFATFILAASSSASGQSAPGCALTGSENVSVEGKGMLRLGDVAGCPGLRYEVVPNVLINGQPAVRLLPSEECVADSADSVFADGGAVARQGDVICAPKP